MLAASTRTVPLAPLLPAVEAGILLVMVTAVQSNELAAVLRDENSKHSLFEEYDAAFEVCP
jgi:hypothetical protein